MTEAPAPGSPAWRGFRQRIRAGWTSTDTLVLATNNAACVLFIGNCHWRSADLSLLATIMPIALQAAWSIRHPGPLRTALAFGFLVALFSPLGEGLFVQALGWWGEYLAPGTVVWKTPVYCMLIGWLASTHLFYLGRRTLELGFAVRYAVAACAITALGLGALGENLFVWAGIWRYHPSGLDFFAVPAFLPLAYAAGYAVLPLLRSWPLLPATLLCGTALLFACAGFGMLTGFFPR